MFLIKALYRFVKDLFAVLSTSIIKNSNIIQKIRILRQHRVLRNVRKSKNIIITKSDKGNRVVILDQKLYINAIEEIISDTSNFESSMKTQP